MRIQSETRVAPPRQRRLCFSVLEVMIHRVSVAKGRRTHRSRATLLPWIQLSIRDRLFVGERKVDVSACYKCDGSKEAATSGLFFQPIKSLPSLRLALAPAPKPGGVAIGEALCSAQRSVSQRFSVL